MTPLEARLLALVEKHLRTHACPTCGRQWLTGKSVGVLFHSCRSSHPLYDWRTPAQRHDDERRDWVLNVFGQALEDELGDRAYLDGGEEE